MITKIYKNTVFFGTGAYFYGLLEVLCRGYTHFSMLIAGGVCFVLIAALSALKRLNFIFKCIISGGIITAVEFAFGCIFNLWLGLNVWDYSDVPYNVLGQICPKFFGIWVAVGALALLLGKGMNKGLSKPAFMFSKFTLGKHFGNTAGKQTAENKAY
mgnify:CR=1 FL=1